MLFTLSLHKLCNYSINGCRLFSLIFFGCLGLETSTDKNKYFVLHIYREVSYMALKLRARPSVSPFIPTGLNPYVDNLR